MLFKDKFYTIKAASKEDNVFSYSIKLNKDHAIFSGHFPGNPVTPGVVQMEIIKELVRESLPKPIKLDSMSNCKFLAILNPETVDEVEVILYLTENDNGQFKLNAVIQNSNAIFLKMSALYSFI